MSSSSSLLPLLSLALKNKDLVNAERYLSGVALTILVYDYMLTFGDEVRYIWRRPISNIKVLYLVLRYSVLLAELVYFQALSGLTTHLTHNLCRVFNRGGISRIYGTCPRELVYTLWDHRKWMLQTLYIGYALSVCATIAFVVATCVELLPRMIYDPIIFRMCLIVGRSPYWIGIWLSQALFDVFLFVLTLFNAASRPRRANVKIITDLRRDGCVFYLGLFVGRFLNIALSIPTDKEYYPIAVSFVLSLSTVSVTRLVLRVERLLATRGGSRDFRIADWMYNSYELRPPDSCQD